MIMSMKNSNDIIRNRTRDLPACSAVPQPTAVLRAPIPLIFSVIITTLHIKGIINSWKEAFAV
jgi:hypothetical protein